MKNKKGFTFIEIVSIIAVLAVIVVLMFPRLQSSLFGAKNNIKQMNIDSIIESTELLLNEVLYCELNEDKLIEYGFCTGEIPCSCSEAKEDILSGNVIEITLSKLKENSYYQDISDNCNEDGKVIITTTNTVESNKIIKEISYGNNQIIIKVNDDICK